MRSAQSVIPCSAEECVVAAETLYVVVAVSTSDDVWDVLAEVKSADVLTSGCDVLYRPAKRIKDNHGVRIHLVEENRALQLIERSRA